MNLENESCYQALLARDCRFDGIFYVAVRSTRIYCRPVCTVKPPMLKNCTFYPSAAICEREGYRPCLRCRPELAPGSSSVDANSNLVSRAARCIEDGALLDLSLAELACQLGVSDRHLRRVFESELGVTPVQFVQTQRLLNAKRLLTDTDLPISQIAMLSGFSSLRRFNALFVERYRLNPSQLRKKVTGRVTEADGFVCHLAFRPPYDWKSMLSFLDTRGGKGVELVDNECYQRTVLIDDTSGWISVAMNQKNNSLIVTLSASLAPKFMQVLTRVKRLFDLEANPYLIESVLGELAANHPGLRVAGAFDPFEIAIRAILGQVISVKAATNLAGKLAAKFGVQITTPNPTLNRHTPQPGELANLRETDLTELGIMPSIARTLISFAKAYSSGSIILAPGANYEDTVEALIALPGIGPWTADYIAMRCLAWPDAFMHGDLGVKKALGHSNKKALIELVQKYRPWRAYATMHLWKSLEEKGA